MRLSFFEDTHFSILSCLGFDFKGFCSRMSFGIVHYFFLAFGVLILSYLMAEKSKIGSHRWQHKNNRGNNNKKHTLLDFYLYGRWEGLYSWKWVVIDVGVMLDTPVSHSEHSFLDSGYPRKPRRVGMAEAWLG